MFHLVIQHLIIVMKVILFNYYWDFIYGGWVIITSFLSFIGCSVIQLFLTIFFGIVIYFG